MLQLIDEAELIIHASNGDFSFDELVTASDIKKRMRDHNTSFLQETKLLILVAMDDNGNSYYVKR